MLSILPILPLLTFLHLGAPAGIPWMPSVDAALAEAKAKNRPVFIAVNMDNERANDELVKVHYQDERIIKLASQCACLFASVAEHGSGNDPCPRCGSVTCADHRAVEHDARARWMKSGATGEIVAPAHLFIDGSGKVLMSVNYSITRGELEWCLYSAIKACDPKFTWEMSSAAHAPRRLVNNGVADPTEIPKSAPTKAEVEQLLDTVQKGGRPWEHREEIGRLMQSDDKRAVDYVAGALNSRASTRDDVVVTMLHNIGRLSPAAYWEMVVPWVDDARAPVRAEAIVALEQLAVPKSIAVLQKRWKAEKDVDVRAELVRALAAVDPAGKHTIQVVMEQAEKAKEARVRISAVIAGARFEDPKAVAALVKSALAADVSGVRAAAAYVVGVRREAALRADLDAAALKEPDTSVKHAMDLAIEVMNGGNVELLNKVADEFDRSPIKRERL